MMMTTVAPADTHCAYCGDEFEADDERAEAPYGDVHVRHFDLGEITDEFEDDGNPDDAYDRVCDAAYGV